MHNKINIKELVEVEVNNIWKDFKNEDFCKFSPNSILEVPNDGIIFVGINPSLSKKERNRLINEGNPINCQFHKLIYEKEKEYRYFKKFFIVAEQTKLNWGHIDILFNRETNQKKVKSLLKTEKGKDFIYRQCMVTKKVIETIIDENNPKIFVITNAFARELLGKYRKINDPINTNENWIDFDFVWNDDFGTYTYKNQPFFFSGMLTGQRALDNGSFERLIWQINRVKNKIKTVYNNV